jgi:hypothetical protein
MAVWILGSPERMVARLDCVLLAQPGIQDWHDMPNVSRAVWFERQWLHARLDRQRQLAIIMDQNKNSRKISLPIDVPVKNTISVN